MTCSLPARRTLQQREHYKPNRAVGSPASLALAQAIRQARTNPPIYDKKRGRVSWLLRRPTRPEFGKSVVRS
jgi:hypothetical protein